MEETSFKSPPGVGVELKGMVLQEFKVIGVLRQFAGKRDFSLWFKYLL